MMSGDSGSSSGGPVSAPAPASAGEGTALKTVVATAPALSNRSLGLFTLTAGHEIGRVISIPVGNIVTLGRSEECVVRFDDANLSRVHARVMRLGTDYVLDDLGSTNGTFVNDARLSGSTTLRDGDRIQLGSSTTLRFSLVDEAEEAALRKLYDQAVHDGLTGVSNRKHLEERLEIEIAFALRHKTHLSVVMLDVDFFKRVNDTYGHLAGDAVLRRMGELLARAVRTEDLVARYGGEEFVIVARGIDGPHATMFAERLRQTIAQTAIEFEGQQLHITSSAGVASLVDCRDKLDRSSLLAVADARLYQAKQAGRNRVVGPD